MQLSTISEWLVHLEKCHSAKIALGLERVKAVGHKLDLLKPKAWVITIGGTNGKGSCIAGLEGIYRQAGFYTGTFTSPFLVRPNEEIKLNGQEVTDEQLCAAFSAIDAARGATVLTYFEYFTLAAFFIFKQYALDIWLLEIGLGGRLDAVNIIDADLAIITSIGIDHTEWLGNTREQIALEKAGILRPNRLGICGDRNPPVTLVDYAKRLPSELLFLGKDFDYHQEEVGAWSFTYQDTRYADLPFPSLALENMAIVLMAVTLFQSYLPITRDDIVRGLLNLSLPCRIQIVEGPIRRILDVAHNPDAIAFLNKALQKMQTHGKNYAVFSMLADKDIVNSLKEIKSIIDHWYVSPLIDPRGANEKTLRTALAENQISKINFYQTLPLAYQAAMQRATFKDTVVVFGSFKTVAKIKQIIEQETLRQEKCST